MNNHRPFILFVFLICLAGYITIAQAGLRANQPLPALAQDSMTENLIAIERTLVYTTTFTLDGVDITVVAPSLPTGNWGIAEPNNTNQVATLTQLKPYFQELTIQSIPFGIIAGTESNLPISTSGNITSFIASLKEFRQQQGAVPFDGPRIRFFNESIDTLASIVYLNIYGNEKTPTLIIEGFVESGSRIWLFRYSENYNVNNLSNTIKMLEKLNITAENINNLTTIELKSSMNADRLLDKAVEYNNAPSSLPFPPWWSGNCNANNHPGSYSVGATYDGLVACGPGTHTWTVNFGAGVPQLEWQCAELSKRFLYLKYGIPPYMANGSQVVWNYSGSLLQKITNGVSGQAPVPGDVLSYGSTSTAGHTSVVKSANIDGSGNGTITVIEQNNASDGDSVLAVNNWFVVGNAGSVSGWLHNPNGANPTPTPIPSNCGNYSFNGVVLFENAQCSGSKLEHSSSTGLQNMPSGWNDRISSIYVKSGWSVKTYQHDNGNGASRCIAWTMWDLAQDSFDGGTVNMDNQISSFQVYNNGSCTGSPPPTGQVKLYSQPNQGGTTLHSLGVGLSNDPNPPIASMSMPSGWSAITYDQDNGGGDSRCWNTDVNNFQDYSDWSNRLRSIRVYSSDVCPPPKPTLQSPANGATFEDGQNITLTWSGSGTQYYAEYWGGPGGTINSGWQSGTSWNIGSQWPNYIYSWRVKARNSNGESSWSSTRTFNVNPSGPPVPTYPIQFYQDANYGSEFCYGSSAGDYLNIDGCTGYNDTISSMLLQSGWSVRLYKHANLEGSSRCLTANDDNFADNTFEDGTSLDNQISSFSLYNQSNCPPPIPPMPSNLQADNTTRNSITFSWQDNSSNETGFHIYRWGFNGIDWEFLHHDSVSANSTTYTDTNLQCDTNYFYKVSAYNNAGESPQAGWIEIGTSACPTATPTTQPTVTPIVTGTPKPITPTATNSPTMTPMPPPATATATTIATVTATATINASSVSTPTRTPVATSTPTPKEIKVYLPMLLKDGEINIAQQFIGNWRNEDANTGGITRANIRSESNMLAVHMWGACHPTDCDWGEISTTSDDVEDGEFALIWRFSHAVNTQQVSLMPDGRLRVMSHTHFIDDSGRSDYDALYFFVRE